MYPSVIESIHTEPAKCLVIHRLLTKLSIQVLYSKQLTTQVYLSASSIPFQCDTNITTRHIEKNIPFLAFLILEPTQLDHGMNNYISISL